MYKRFWYVIIVLFVIGPMACTSDKGKDYPNVDHIQIDSKIIRFDRDLFQANSSETILSVLQRHRQLSDIFTKFIMGLEATDTSIIVAEVDSFINLPVSQNISRLIDSSFQDVSSIEQDWIQALRNYNYHFPGRDIPDLYFLQSNLAIANFVFQDDEENDAVGASLDFFLGQAYPYKALARDNPAFSDYNNRTFNKDHLVTKCVSALISDMVGEESEIRLLNVMIHEGKKLFLLDQLCPHLSDTAVFEFTKEQLAWCENNEKNIWSFLVEQELLYETSLAKIAKYTSPFPNSPGMPEESPGRTANFIGYKIIDAYMSRNPDLTLIDLIMHKDAQAIFNASKYRPRR